LRGIALPGRQTHRLGMTLVLNMAAQVDAIARAQNADAVSDAALHFAAALKPYGVTGIATRAYQLPEGPINNVSVWNAHGWVAVKWPDNWQDSPGYRHICFTENPLLDATLKGRTYFLWSDAAPRDRHGTYWEAWSEGRVTEGMAVIAVAPGRRRTSLALAFEEFDASPTETAAIRMAATVLVERTAALCHTKQKTPILSPRERDCLAFVAAGKSDWEISVILSLSQNTVRSYVDTARKKLDAQTRTHAVARAMALGLI